MTAQAFTHQPQTCFSIYKILVKQGLRITFFLRITFLYNIPLTLDSFGLPRFCLYENLLQIGKNTLENYKVILMSQVRIIIFYIKSDLYNDSEARKFLSWELTVMVESSSKCHNSYYNLWRCYHSVNFALMSDRLSL